MQAFVAVADLQGFAPAARKLALSPSAVTRLIAALEDRLGARLLQRTTRQVALTDAGARYLERAAADSGRCRGSRRLRSRANARARGGRLVVSAPVGFGRLHVSPVIVGLSEALSRGRRGPAAVGSHDQPGGGRRRSRGQDRPSAGLDCSWRAMSARCGGSWWPRRAISESARRAGTAGGDRRA